MLTSSFPFEPHLKTSRLPARAAGITPPYNPHTTAALMVLGDVRCGFRVDVCRYEPGEVGGCPQEQFWNDEANASREPHPSAHPGTSHRPTPTPPRAQTTRLTVRSGPQ